ncbi:MAG: HEAT repeat domain-containing protein, partial [Candidatus Omnitrophica bacterium]|nr:HEAT repeat domain-containing protein [Candidatus Omnitrophota bacterium]
MFLSRLRYCILFRATIVVVALNFLASNTAFGIELKNPAATSTLAPPSRSGPIGIEWDSVNNKYNITVNNELKGEAQEWVAFTYLGVLIGQFLYKLHVLSDFGMTSRGIRKKVDHFKNERLKAFRNAIKSELPHVNFERFRFEEIYWDNNTICVPYERKDKGHVELQDRTHEYIPPVQTLRYYLSREKSEETKAGFLPSTIKLHKLEIPIGIDDVKVVLEDPREEDDAPVFKVPKGSQMNLAGIEFLSNNPRFPIGELVDIINEQEYVGFTREEAIETVRSALGGKPESQTRLEEFERLLTEKVVISDGRTPAGRTLADIQAEFELALKGVDTLNRQVCKDNLKYIHYIVKKYEFLATGPNFTAVLGLLKDAHNRTYVLDMVPSFVKTNPDLANKDNFEFIPEMLTDKSADVRERSIGAVASFIKAKESFASEINLSVAFNMVRARLQDKEESVRHRALDSIPLFIKKDKTLATEENFDLILKALVGKHWYDWHLTELICSFVEANESFIDEDWLYTFLSILMSGGAVPQHCLRVTDLFYNRDKATFTQRNFDLVLDMLKDESYPTRSISALELIPLFIKANNTLATQTNLQKVIDALEDSEQRMDVGVLEIIKLFIKTNKNLAVDPNLTSILTILRRHPDYFRRNFLEVMDLFIEASVEVDIEASKKIATEENLKMVLGFLKDRDLCVEASRLLYSFGHANKASFTEGNLRFTIEMLLDEKEFEYKGYFIDAMWRLSEAGESTFTEENFKLVRDMLEEKTGDIRYHALKAAYVFITANKKLCTQVNFRLIADMLIDIDDDVREDAASLIPLFIEADKGLATGPNFKLVLDMLNYKGRYVGTLALDTDFKRKNRIWEPEIWGEMPPGRLDIISSFINANRALASESNYNLILRMTKSIKEYVRVYAENAIPAFIEQNEAFNSETNLSLVLGMLTSCHTDVRMAAIHYLGRRRDPRTVEPLLQVLKKDYDWRVCEAASNALSGMYDVEKIRFYYGQLVGYFADYLEKRLKEEPEYNFIKRLEGMLKGQAKLRQETIDFAALTWLWAPERYTVLKFSLDSLIFTVLYDFHAREIKLISEEDLSLLAAELIEPKDAKEKPFLGDWTQKNQNLVRKIIDGFAEEYEKKLGFNFYHYFPGCSFINSGESKARFTFSSKTFAPTVVFNTRWWSFDEFLAAVNSVIPYVFSQALLGMEWNPPECFRLPDCSVADDKIRIIVNEEEKGFQTSGLLNSGDIYRCYKMIMEEATSGLLANLYVDRQVNVSAQEKEKSGLKLKAEADAERFLFEYKKLEASLESDLRESRLNLSKALADIAVYEASTKENYYLSLFAEDKLKEESVAFHKLADRVIDESGLSPEKQKLFRKDYKQLVRAFRYAMISTSLEVPSKSKIPFDSSIDFKEMALFAAREITSLLLRKPAAVIGLATGSTMPPVYEMLANYVNDFDIDLSTQPTFFNLDEYYYPNEANPQIYRKYMSKNFYGKIRKKEHRPRLVEVEHKDGKLEVKKDERGSEGNAYLPEVPESPRVLDAFCGWYEKAIKEKGGIDLQLLGIGRGEYEKDHRDKSGKSFKRKNDGSRIFLDKGGHIGFNEPLETELGCGQGKHHEVLREALFAIAKVLPEFQKKIDGLHVEPQNPDHDKSLFYPLLCAGIPEKVFGNPDVQRAFGEISKRYGVMSTEKIKEMVSFFACPTRKVNLTLTTRRANKEDFASASVADARYAVSMGLGSILRGRRIILLANGDEKADVIAACGNGTVTPYIPATILQLHPNAKLMVDELAGEHLLDNPHRFTSEEWIIDLLIKLSLKEGVPIKELTPEQILNDEKIEIYLGKANMKPEEAKRIALEKLEGKAVRRLPENTLVIATQPHPDDVPICVGGLVAQLAGQGDRGKTKNDIRLLTATNGYTAIWDCDQWFEIRPGFNVRGDFIKQLLNGVWDFEEVKDIKPFAVPDEARDEFRGYVIALCDVSPDLRKEKIDKDKKGRRIRFTFRNREKKPGTGMSKDEFINIIIKKDLPEISRKALSSILDEMDIAYYDDAEELQEALLEKAKSIKDKELAACLEGVDASGMPERERLKLEGMIERLNSMMKADPPTYEELVTLRYQYWHGKKKPIRAAEDKKAAAEIGIPESNVKNLELPFYHTMKEGVKEQADEKDLRIIRKQLEDIFVSGGYMFKDKTARNDVIIRELKENDLNALTPEELEVAVLVLDYIYDGKPIEEIKVELKRQEKVGFLARLDAVLDTISHTPRILEPILFLISDDVDPMGTHGNVQQGLRKCVDQLLGEYRLLKPVAFVHYHGAWGEYPMAYDLARVVNFSEAVNMLKQASIKKHESQDPAKFPGDDIRPFWKRALDRNTVNGEVLRNALTGDVITEKYAEVIKVMVITPNEQRSLKPPPATLKGLVYEVPIEKGVETIEHGVIPQQPHDKTEPLSPEGGGMNPASITRIATNPNMTAKELFEEIKAQESAGFSLEEAAQAVRRALTGKPEFQDRLAEFETLLAAHTSKSCLTAQELANRVIMAAEGTPAKDLIEALELHNFKGVILKDKIKNNLFIYRGEIEPRDNISHTLKGIEILLNELGNFKHFDFLLDCKGRLIAIFPVVPDTEKQEKEILYFDFSRFYVDKNLLGTFGERTRAGWLDFTAKSKLDRAAVSTYLEYSSIHYYTGNLRAAEFWDYDWQTPFVGIEVNKKTGKINLTPFYPEDLFRNDLDPETTESFSRIFEEHPEYERTIFVVFPTVYSPARYDKDMSSGKLLKARDDIASTEYMLREVSKIRFAAGDAILDSATGTGYLLWIDWIATGKDKRLRYYGLDINPLAVACAKVNMEIAGTQVTVKQSDNIVSPEGKYTFSDTHFKLITSNSPLEVSMDFPRTPKLEELHDGVDYFARFSHGILNRLLADGVAYSWHSPTGQKGDYTDDSAFEILKSFGLDVSVG